MTEKKTGSRSFGMFRGVFIPTFLTIIGVIMYLRLGRIVGEAGIFGAVAIILLAVSVTISTGLSLSSITTNIRIGAGGLFIFPYHPRIIVLLSTILVMFILTFISVKYAIRAQVIVFLIVLASLISIFLGGGWWHHIATVPAIGEFPKVTFWLLFALFFPAVTGLMSGVGLSGELTDPKKQIPRGVMLALGATTIIYLAMAFWFGYSAPSSELIADNLIIVKLAAFAPLVLVGILAATFSSALTTLVAAPRLLNALSENYIFIFNPFFAKKSKSGEPRNATLFTVGIIAATLAVGSLDAVAPVLTMFFLISYAMINLVVFVEQYLGLVSYRPLFKIPKAVPLYGFIVSIAIMFFINAIAGIFALFFLFVMYLFLVKRKLPVKEGFVRSGLFFALSEWAAKKVVTLAESPKHIWKPNVLLPVQASRSLQGNYPLIKSIVFPHGILSVLGMDVRKGQVPKEEALTKKQKEEERAALPSLVKKLGQEGIFTSYAYIEISNYIDGVCISLQAMEGQFFHPNILFIPSAPHSFSASELNKLTETIKDANAGLIMFDKDEDIGLGAEEDISVWIPPSVLEKDFYEERRFDLALLIALRMVNNWDGKLTLRMCIEKQDKEAAHEYLRRLVYDARLPATTQIIISAHEFPTELRKAMADIHILSVPDAAKLKKLSTITKNIRGSFLFTVDSTLEDILA